MSHDLRSYARQTNFRLVLGFLLLLFILGDGLIYIFYGRNAAAMGLICLGMGLAPALLIWLVLMILGWMVSKVNR